MSMSRHRSWTRTRCSSPGATSRQSKLAAAAAGSRRPAPARRLATHRMAVRLRRVAIQRGRTGLTVVGSVVRAAAVMPVIVAHLADVVSDVMVPHVAMLLADVVGAIIGTLPSQRGRGNGERCG